MANSLFSPNPAMERGFVAAEAERRLRAEMSSERMTVNGTISITVFLLAAVILAGAVGWFTMIPAAALVSFVASLVLAFVISFKPHLAPKLALPYALLEGYWVGFVSRNYNSIQGFENIVLQAVGLTVAITVVLLALYRSGVINPSAKFKAAVAAATGGVALFYLVSLGLSLAGISNPLMWGSSGLAIVFSLAVVVLAAANLVVDFDFIAQGERQGLPKQMEWYGAFGLMVTIVWLYLELLRLLSKLRR